MEHNEFARANHIPIPSIKKWVSLPAPNLRPVNLERLARGLGLDVEAVAEVLEKAKRAAAAEDRSVIGRIGPGVPIGEGGGTIDSRGRVVNVNKPDAKMIRYVPIINSIAAGPFTERTDLDYPAGFADDHVPVALGDAEAFALWIDGESMLPRYEPGDLVVFRSIDPTPEQIVEGGDYAVQLDASGDHESTFKRLTFHPKLGRRMLIATALNPAYRPRSVEIAASRIARLGHVMMIIPRSQ